MLGVGLATSMVDRATGIEAAGVATVATRGTVGGGPKMVTSRTPPTG